MVIFNTSPPPPPEYGMEDERSNPEAEIEEPLLAIHELGTTTYEAPGQQNLIQGTLAEIKKGVREIELAMGQGGPVSPVGAESYGNEAREAFREIAAAAGIKYGSVHVPTNVNGLSGYNPQQGAFSDELRKMGQDEISKGIRFSAEVTGGSAVVVHQSEFDRPVSEEDWAQETLADGTKRYKFMSSPEEAERAVFKVVDERNGRVMPIAQKNMILERPLWRRAEKDDWITDWESGQRIFVEAGEYVDKDGRPARNISERVPIMGDDGNFRTEDVTWKDIERETSEWNAKHPDDNIDPAVYYYRLSSERQIAQQLGSAQYYSQGYEDRLRSRDKVKEAIQYYKKLEQEIPPDERWKIQVPKRIAELVPADQVDPSKYLEDNLREINRSLQFSHESAANAQAQARQAERDLQNIKSIKEYALNQTANTLGVAGIEAWEQSKNNKYAKRDIYLAVENWDPNMYGSHPDELIDMMKRGKERMIEMMTTQRKQNQMGEWVENPYFQKGITKDQAKEYADRHLKITLDTEHIGLWRKKFLPQPGETREQTNQRFNGWYLEQVDKLGKSGLIGHVHLVDGIEGAHQQLPAGQGEYPLKEVIKNLRKNGYTGTIVSEGFGENSRFGLDRGARKPWEFFGNRITRTPFPVGGGPQMPQTFNQVSNNYYGKGQSPMFIMGSYVPSNDWQLWSQVPLE